MYLRPMGAKVPAIYGESYDSAKAKSGRVKRLALIAICVTASACSRAGSTGASRRGAGARYRGVGLGGRTASGSVAGRVQATGTAVVVLEPKTRRGRFRRRPKSR